MLVNVPGPVLASIREVEHLPGVVSGKAFVGFAAEPVVHGRADDSFRVDSLAGSLDGEYFQQDRVTVVAGELPPLDATDQIVLTPELAQIIAARVGGRVRYEIARLNPPTGVPTSAVRSTFVVAAIVDAPPVLVDQFDEVNSALLPPAATARYLNGGFEFGWAGLRLRAGPAGIPALQRELSVPEETLDRALHVPAGTITFNVRRLDTVHHQVQQALDPQAVALALFAGLAALALLVLAGQGLAQLLDLSAASVPAIWAVGATRAQTAAAISLDGVVAVLGGMALSVAGAVRHIPAGTGRACPRVRPCPRNPGGPAGARWRRRRARCPVPCHPRGAGLAVGPPGGERTRQQGLTDRQDGSCGRPAATAVVGIRAALGSGAERRPTQVLATLLGSAAAVLAVVMAVVFGASLNALVTHPTRYGWNWTLLMDTQGGYGSWSPAQMQRLVSGQPGVTGWSTFAFTQIPIDNQDVPVLGLTRYLGWVQPPTTSGQPISGPRQIELGTATLRQLGKHVGQTVIVGTGRHRRKLTIVGTVTLPSMGLALADHVSLGRGAMLPDSTLLAAQGPAHLTTQQQEAAVSEPAFPSAVAIDLAPGASHEPPPQAAHLDCRQ